MKKYKVRVPISTSLVFYNIEADSKEEAIEYAMDNEDMGDADSGDYHEIEWRYAEAMEDK